MTPYRGMVFDNRPVAPVFLDSSPVSDGVAQFATALIQAPMMKQQIQSQRGAAAVEQAFKKRQLAHQERMDQMTNLFRQQELDLQKQKMEKGKAPKIHWRQGYGETGLPEGAPVPYVMGPDGRLQEVPIGPEAVPGAEPPPVNTSGYPDGEFTWYNPADWYRYATSGPAASTQAPGAPAATAAPSPGETSPPPPPQGHAGADLITRFADWWNHQKLPAPLYGAHWHQRHQQQQQGNAEAAAPLPKRPSMLDTMREQVDAPPAPPSQYAPRQVGPAMLDTIRSLQQQPSSGPGAVAAYFKQPQASPQPAPAPSPQAMAGNQVEEQPRTRHRTWSAGSLEAAMQAPDSDDPMQAGEAQLAQGLAALRAAANAGDQRAMQAAKQAVAQLLSHPEMGPHLTAVYRGFRETGN